MFSIDHCVHVYLVFSQQSIFHKLSIDHFVRSDCSWTGIVSELGTLKLFAGFLTFFKSFSQVVLQPVLKYIKLMT